MISGRSFRIALSMVISAPSCHLSGHDVMIVSILPVIILSLLV
jgi:hypothetical protein